MNTTATTDSPVPVPTNFLTQPDTKTENAPSNATAVKSSTSTSRKNEIRDSIIAGSLAGMTSCTLFHPFDVVRTKMQTATSFNAASTSTAATSIANAAANIKAVSAASTAHAARQSTTFPTTASATTAVNNVNVNVNSTNTTTNSSISRNLKMNMKLNTPIKTISDGGGKGGPMSVISHTFKNGGIRAFYTGISLPVAAQAIYKSTILTTNRISSQTLQSYQTNENYKTGTFTPYNLTLYDRFLCGSLSGAINAMLFVCPVEYVRNQLIDQHTKISQNKPLSKAFRKGPLDVIRNTLKYEGIFGLWTGAGVTILRDSIGCGAFFFMFEIGQMNIPKVLSYYRGTSQEEEDYYSLSCNSSSSSSSSSISSSSSTSSSSFTTTIGSGLLAGFGYWFVSLPLDSLKTLVQTGKTTSAIHTVQTSIQNHGVHYTIRQLYRGWQVAFGRGAPAAAVTLTTYSVVYNFCEEYFH